MLHLAQYPRRLPLVSVEWDGGLSGTRLSEGEAGAWPTLLSSRLFPSPLVSDTHLSPFTAIALSKTGFRGLRLSSHFRLVVLLLPSSRSILSLCRVPVYRYVTVELGGILPRPLPALDQQDAKEREASSLNRCTTPLFLHSPTPFPRTPSHRCITSSPSDRRSRSKASQAWEGRRVWEQQERRRLGERQRRVQEVALLTSAANRSGVRRKSMR
jgi:hypothetical protein